MRQQEIYALAFYGMYAQFMTTDIIYFVLHLIIKLYIMSDTTPFISSAFVYSSKLHLLCMYMKTMRPMNLFMENDPYYYYIEHMFDHQIFFHVIRIIDEKGSKLYCYVFLSQYDQNMIGLIICPTLEVYFACSIQKFFYLLQIDYY